MSGFRLTLDTSALTELEHHLLFERITWQWLLAHNLAVAGALCEAFERGEYRGANRFKP